MKNSKENYHIPQNADAIISAKVEILNKIHRKFRHRETHPKNRKGDLDDHDYWKLQRRTTEVYSLVVRKKRLFDQSDLHQWSLEWYLSGLKNKKEYGRQKFETQYQFSPWFMQASFGSDYGEYTCEECRRTFYHSPCALYLAGKQKKNCLCGYCANSYATSNNQEKIYHGTEY